MIDRKQVCTGLKEYWIKVRQRAPAERERSQKWLEKELSQPQHRFLRAALLYRTGNLAPLVDYLRSDEPLSADDRATLADLVEKKDGKSLVKRGRPLNQKLHDAASTAMQFYREWQQLCRAHGVAIRGESADMRVEAVDFILFELYPAVGKILDREAVNELIRRPIYRRKW